MPAFIETDKNSRIEFGQLREIDRLPTQLTFDLENASQTTLFDSSLKKFPEVPIEEGVEVSVFDNQKIDKNHKKPKGQISIKAFGAYPDSDPDQLYLHYTDKDNLDVGINIQQEEVLENINQISFQKSALYSRRRNRFRTR